MSTTVPYEGGSTSIKHYLCGITCFKPYMMCTIVLCYALIDGYHYLFFLR